MSTSTQKPTKFIGTSMDKEDVLSTVASSRFIGATTAGLRALAAQFFTFYVRVPVKLFRPTRVDYLALPRAINPIYKEKPWSIFTHSGPALLAHAVKTYGWSFIPNHVLPPLFANSAVGLVLYSTYLTSLTLIEKSRENEWKQTHYFGNANPATIHLYLRNHSSIMVDAFYSGMLAGAAQSLAAAPIDAIVTRFSASELINGDHKTMWAYGISKLKEIGPRGVFSGFTLSLTKESLGFGLFFSAFETVKGPWYRSYINCFHDGDTSHASKAVYPSFILFAGALSSVAVQAVHYPLGKIQKLYLMRLEALDEIAKQNTKQKEKLKAQQAQRMKYAGPEGKNLFSFMRYLITNRNHPKIDWKTAIYNFIIPPHSAFRLYSNGYIHTFMQAHKLVAKDAGGSWYRWLYGGFFRSTLATMPSTSIGLVVFEIMRLRYTNPDNGLSDPNFSEKVLSAIASTEDEGS